MLIDKYFVNAAAGYVVKLTRNVDFSEFRFYEHRYIYLWTSFQSSEPKKTCRSHEPKAKLNSLTHFSGDFGFALGSLYDGSHVKQISLFMTKNCFLAFRDKKT